MALLMLRLAGLNCTPPRGGKATLGSSAFISRKRSLTRALMVYEFWRTNNSVAIDRSLRTNGVLPSETRVSLPGMRLSSTMMSEVAW